MGDFSADLSRFMAVMYPGRRGIVPRIHAALTNSELSCIACYRFGQFAVRRRRIHRVSGSLLVLVHRIWNRFITRIDHCEISSGARIGPGLVIMHRNGIHIAPVLIGRNCTIHHGLTIGQGVAKGDAGVGRVGDEVWIGPGVIIAGAVTIGDGATISAGAVISRDVPAGCLVGGNPGRVLVRDYDREGM
ncbi:serine O-acetyltransferase [Propionibacterium cyclohexanicum]|uniref:Serine acetyltransferase n=1 Tax=Propionibacterium cyclohexanicum TaxID=64702 RepID=A0A1H9T1W6_9ACTN|nr:serine acetyltransferase [Propionibacterium cyclohexanicum]SER91262.1 serine O-acetyltransferase [Propionibacterium cyclohexanicum]